MVLGPLSGVGWGGASLGRVMSQSQHKSIVQIAKVFARWHEGTLNPDCVSEERRNRVWAAYADLMEIGKGDGQGTFMHEAARIYRARCSKCARDSSNEDFVNFFAYLRDEVLLPSRPLIKGEGFLRSRLVTSCKRYLAEMGQDEGRMDEDLECVRIAHFLRYWRTIVGHAVYSYFRAQTKHTSEQQENLGARVPYEEARAVPSAGGSAWIFFQDDERISVLAEELERMALSGATFAVRHYFLADSARWCQLLDWAVEYWASEVKTDPGPMRRRLQNLREMEPGCVLPDGRIHHRCLVEMFNTSNGIIRKRCHDAHKKFCARLAHTEQETIRGRAKA